MAIRQIESGKRCKQIVFDGQEYFADKKVVCTTLVARRVATKYVSEN